MPHRPGVRRDYGLCRVCAHSLCGDAWTRPPVVVSCKARRTYAGQLAVDTGLAQLESYRQCDRVRKAGMTRRHTGMDGACFGYLS